MLMYTNATDIKVSLDEIRMMETPAPRGARHLPIPFGDFIDATRQAVDGRGHVIEVEEYVVSHDGERFFGALQIDGANGWKPIVGIRGSHDQSVSRGICVGTRVIVCSNLCFNGDLGKWSTRQTTNIWDRVSPLIDDAIDGLGSTVERLTVDFDGYRARDLTAGEGDALLLACFRAGGLSGAQLARSIGEWDVPSYDHGEPSLWRVFNAATESLKPQGTRGSVETLERRSRVVHRVMQEALAGAGDVVAPAYGTLPRGGVAVEAPAVVVEARPATQRGWYRMLADAR
jgi:hypothetical protein|tara:strand:+ start:999 stop:1859 length:861 start_codon:yes stop_codon:yes gene_type:complete